MAARAVMSGKKIRRKIYSVRHEGIDNLLRQFQTPIHVNLDAFDSFYKASREGDIVADLTLDAFYLVIIKERSARLDAILSGLPKIFVGDDYRPGDEDLLSKEDGLYYLVMVLAEQQIKGLTVQDLSEGRGRP